MEKASEEREEHEGLFSLERKADRLFQDVSYPDEILLTLDGLGSKKITLKSKGEAEYLQDPLAEQGWQLASKIVLEEGDLS